MCEGELVARVEQRATMMTRTAVMLVMVATTVIWTLTIVMTVADIPSMSGDKKHHRVGTDILDAGMGIIE